MAICETAHLDHSRAGNREKTDLRLQRAKQYDLETNRTQGKNEKSGRAEAPQLRLLGKWLLLWEEMKKEEESIAVMIVFQNSQEQCIEREMSEFHAFK